MILMFFFSFFSAEGFDTFGLFNSLADDQWKEHFHAYEIRKVSKKKFLSVTDLLDYHPVLFNKAGNGKSYVILHYLL